MRPTILPGDELGSAEERARTPAEPPTSAVRASVPTSTPRSLTQLQRAIGKRARPYRRPPRERPRRPRDDMITAPNTVSCPDLTTVGNHDSFLDPASRRRARRATRSRRRI
jgi:hypothetical protein